MTNRCLAWDKFLHSFYWQKLCCMGVSFKIFIIWKGLCGHVNVTSAIPIDNDVIAKGQTKDA